MTTLAAVNDTLISQNDVLLGIAKNTDRTGDRLESFLAQFKTDKLKDLEKEREKKRSAAGMVQAAAGSVNQQRKRISAGLGGFFDKLGLGSGLGAGAALGFLTAAGSRLVTRGIPGLLAIGFADEIANYLLGPEGDKDVKKAIEGAITGGAIGALFGKKALIIGTLIGSVASNKTVSEELDKLGDNVNTFLKNLGFNVGETAAETGKTGLAFISETIGDGLKGVNALFEGDYAGFAEDWKSVLATFGGLALLISPKLTLGAGKTTVRGLMQAFKFAGPKGKAIATALAAFGVTLSMTGDSQQTTPSETTPADAGKGPGISPGLATAMGVGAVTGGAVYGLTRNQRDALAGRGKYQYKPPKPPVTATSPTKKAKSGYVYDEKAKRFRNSTTGEFAKAADAEILKRFPRLAKLLSFLGKGNPVLNMIFSSAAIATIILDDKTYPTTKSKSRAIAKELAGAFSGLFLGAAVGTALGLMGLNPVTIGIGALGGSIAGYFAGEAMMSQLLEYLLGGDPSSQPSLQSNLQTEEKISSSPMSTSMPTTEENNLPTASGIIDAVALKDSSISNAIIQSAMRNNMDPARLFALAKVESNFDPSAVGDSGQSIGMFQLKKVAVDDVNRIYGTKFKYSDRIDLMKSADIAAKYYQAQKTRYGAGNEFNAARFYNQGPGGGQSREASMAGFNYARKLDRATNYFDQKIDQSVQNSQPLILPNHDAYNKNIYIRDGYSRTHG